MSDIVKGALGGAWPLIVGWILPTAVLTAVFGVVVLPSLSSTPVFELLAGGCRRTAQSRCWLRPSSLAGCCRACRHPCIACLRATWRGRASELELAPVTTNRRMTRYATSSRTQEKGSNRRLYWSGSPAIRQPWPRSHRTARKRNPSLRVLRRGSLPARLADLWSQLRASVPDALTKDMDAARGASTSSSVSVHAVAARNRRSRVNAADPSRWWILLIVAVVALPRDVGELPKRSGCHRWVGQLRAGDGRRGPPPSRSVDGPRFAGQARRRAAHVENRRRPVDLPLPRTCGR